MKKLKQKITYHYNSVYNYFIFWRLKRKARRQAIKLKQFVGVMPVNNKLRIVYASGFELFNKQRLKNKEKKISFMDFKKACYIGFYSNGNQCT